MKFINDDAKSVHGAVRVSSVYTSESGEWKLGGFELVSSMNEEDAILYVCAVSPLAEECVLTSSRDAEPSFPISLFTQLQKSQMEVGLL